MIPMLAAFYLDLDERSQFHEHFARFALSGGNLPDNRVTRTQYLYFAAVYVRLSTEEEWRTSETTWIVSRLLQEVESFWKLEPAWQWDRSSFDGGISERLEWKLEIVEPDKSYYKAIIDEELFLFGIAAELYRIKDKWSEITSNEALLLEILDTAFRVFTAEIVFIDQARWLFQPGVWEDHPDYLYAGHEEKVPGMAPAPVSGIAPDSSHSHRMPAWLDSLEKASRLQSDFDADWYGLLIYGLRLQFLEIVVNEPDSSFAGFRLTNFMDGWNGIYRWGYSTQGENQGYGPFELSGTLMYGWWGLLGGSEIGETFAIQASEFPLEDNVLATYVGPNTSRDRHPILAWPAFFENGLAELSMILASKIAYGSDWR
ncbi:MAG: hypothetical protein AMJ59_26960 [Gammaproteobacteria bacterium SG8_31]|nr:MAG: hypothetical protein AMJ59_26960 [Gammaproteobacteria bacterium SG8_31]